MSLPPAPHPENLPPKPTQQEPPSRSPIQTRMIAVFVCIPLIILSLLAWPLVQARMKSPLSSTPFISQSFTPNNPNPEANIQSTPIASLVPSLTATSTISTNLQSNFFSSFHDSPLYRGTVFLAIGEGGFTHLFAYGPLSLPLTRLTDGAWEDITPSLSPNHKQLAFASNRDGQWDIYLLDLENGETIRLTESPEFDAYPTWSPDGQFIAYQTYSGDNFEIVISSIDGSQSSINLSDHPAADFEPSWSPRGRQIAFVSTRTGEPEIWLADLDKVGGERFTNLSQNPQSIESHPSWSKDGSRLAWSATQNGNHSLYVWNNNGGDIYYAGSGDWPTWSPDNTALLTTILEPQETLITASTVEDILLVLPPIILPGPVNGLNWEDTNLEIHSADAFDWAAKFTPTPLWQVVLSNSSGVPGDRLNLVPLQDVQAPYALLDDLTDEAFQALRERVAKETGWDFLATLENAFVPLTDPLPPSMGNDWLYTGRAFAFNTLPLNAGWMSIAPEQFGSQIYWRVYLRTRLQDGSQGTPMQNLPWDFDSRYNGDPLTYEAGGSLSRAIPNGYWVDFTELARSYGWERLPALMTWRSAYFAARMNEFVFKDGEDWHSAILDLYPPEVLITPTEIIPPTLTPRPTSRWYQTPTPTLTLTPRPTLTPLSPTATPSPTQQSNP